MSPIEVFKENRKEAKNVTPEFRNICIFSREKSQFSKADHKTGYFKRTNCKLNFYMDKRNRKLR